MILTTGWELAVFDDKPGWVAVRALFHLQAVLPWCAGCRSGKPVRMWAQTHPRVWQETPARLTDLQSSH